MKDYWGNNFKLPPGFWVRRGKNFIYLFQKEDPSPKMVVGLVKWSPEKIQKRLDDILKRIGGGDFNKS